MLLKVKADNILFQFCKEYIDEVKFPDTNLPFQIRELLNHYFFLRMQKIKCPKCDGHFKFLESVIIHMILTMKNNTYNILEQAYKHKQCDPKTVELLL